MPNPNALSAVVESVVSSTVAITSTNVVVTGSVTASSLSATITPAFDSTTATVNTCREVEMTVEMSPSAVTDTSSHVLP
jgi:hypothetical protein